MRRLDTTELPGNDEGLSATSPAGVHPTTEPSDTPLGRLLRKAETTLTGRTFALAATAVIRGNLAFPDFSERLVGKLAEPQIRHDDAAENLTLGRYVTGLDTGATVLPLGIPQLRITRINDRDGKVVGR